VDAFDRARVRQRVLHFTAARFCRRDAQGWAQALSAREERVTHRFVNGCRFDALGWQRFVERAIDRRACLFQVSGDIEWLTVMSARASCSS
jgi:hypothetical protein